MKMKETSSIILFYPIDKLRANKKSPDWRFFPD